MMVAASQVEATKVSQTGKATISTPIVRMM